MAVCVLVVTRQPKICRENTSPMKATEQKPARVAPHTLRHDQDGLPIAKKFTSVLLARKGPPPLVQVSL